MAICNRWEGRSAERVQVCTADLADGSEPELMIPSACGFAYHPIGTEISVHGLTGDWSIFRPKERILRAIGRPKRWTCPLHAAELREMLRAVRAIDPSHNGAILSLSPNPATEDMMAKKTTKKKPAAKAKKIEHVEIELDSIEVEAIKLAYPSAKMKKQLEEAATLAMSQAVRKVFKEHKISLTAPQAQEVAAFLFGD